MAHLLNELMAKDLWSPQACCIISHNLKFFDYCLSYYWRLNFAVMETASEHYSHVFDASELCGLCPDW